MRVRFERQELGEVVAADQAVEQVDDPVVRSGPRQAQARQVVGDPGVRDPARRRGDPPGEDASVRAQRPAPAPAVT